MKIHDISIRFAGFLLGVSLCAAGCSGGKDYTFRNEGQLCVFPVSDPGTNGFAPADTTPRDYVANETLALSVVFPYCLSGSCTTDRVASCSVAQTGNTFVVSATASYRDTGADICTSDCGRLAAGCGTPVLPAGTFTFEYAGSAVNLAVPSSVPPPCVGTAF